uniref:Uncharacterized protein n=1 Tax=Opuntia streptacantha TaxID=393608 RepID=A0A7C9E1A7_OPUST
MQLLNHSLGGLPGQGSDRECELRLQAHKLARFHVPSVQCAGSDLICLCRACSCTRNTGHHPFNPGQTFQGANVEGCPGSLLHQCPLLFPRGFHRVLGIWSRCG